MPFAVVDFETTGILPALQHRAVEIGITHVDDEGAVTGTWETLINPMRDLGPQRIHGIRGADLLGAPSFEDIAADVLDLIRDRTFVAHNVGFDLRFLTAELGRAGLEPEAEIPHLCTMDLGQRLGVPGRGALEDCCAHYGIEITAAHTAGADSLATARLLGAYLERSRHVDAWRDYWAEIAAVGVGFPLPSAPSRGVAWQPRGTGVAFSAARGFLDWIPDPPLRVAAGGAAATYLEALDRCLLDGVITATEREQLIRIATASGLSRGEVADLNRRYFAALRARAWASGALGEGDRMVLEHVAEALALAPTDASVTAPERVGAHGATEEVLLGDRELHAGDVIVLTGEMTRSRSFWEVRIDAAGFVVGSNVTKRTRVVVAADPDSLSSKAQKARKYGIPVVGESWLEERV